MIEPLDHRSSQRSSGVDQTAFPLPSPPPGLSSRAAQLGLRVLPSPETTQRPGSEVSPGEDPASSGALQLRHELEATRTELNALQDMLEELPAILERKFQQRLRGLMEQQRMLISRNQCLREQLLAQAPSPPPPSLPEGGGGGLVSGLRRSVRRALETAQPLR